MYGRRTTYAYDRNNRLILTTAPDGYTIAQTYDRRGNVITATDALGNTTHYAYDYLGRLVSVTDALDRATTYTYDLKGNLLSQTDAAGKTTYLEYNCRDLLLRKVSPGGRTGTPGAYIYDPTAVLSYTYDALGNTLTRTDRNGNTTVFEWDVHGNLISQAIGSNEISYTYDHNGNVLTTTDPLGTTTRVYDELNRCISKSVPVIGTSSYEYDLTTGLPAGHVAETTTDPKGNVTLREYDRAGRLVRVTDTAADLTTHTVIYTYNDNGSVASVLYPDGAREDYTYTDGNLLSTLTNTLSDGTVLETYVYTYDLARNLLTKQDAKGTTAYTYDPLGRVLTVTEPSGKSTEYTYDGSGNRSTQTVTETGEDESVTVVRTTYTYDERNRLTSLQKHDISDPLLDPILLDVTDYTYDSNGNQLTTTRTTYTNGIAGTPVLIQSNTYDVWNQLIRTVTENGTIVENAYNGDGRRVVKTVNGASTYSLYEYDKVILETNVFGDVTGRNVYGLNLLIRTVGVDTFYYMYNGHADVTALLTPSGAVAASYYYDAFGNILEQTGDVSNAILFAGYQYDKETGLYYLNARMYDPVTARFMQEDTFAGQREDPLSLNLYTYCHNSPLRYVDPTGHTEEALQNAGQPSGLFGMPTNIYYDYYRFHLIADTFRSEERKTAYMKIAYAAMAEKNEEAKKIIQDGLEFAACSEAFYEYARKETVSDLIASDKPGLTPENIESKTLLTQLNIYRDLLLIDPEEAKQNYFEYYYQKWTHTVEDANAWASDNYANQIVTIPIRTVDAVLKMGIGIGHSVAGAWNTVAGDVQSQIHYSRIGFQYITGEISWEQYSQEHAQELKKSISRAVGIASSPFDALNGMSIGTAGLLYYIVGNDNNLLMLADRNARGKDEFLINTFNLDPKSYNDGKGFGQTAIIVATVVLMLKGRADAKAAKNAAKTSRYGPANPGPLPDDIANTFRSGSYTSKVSTGEYVYRVYGDRALEQGSFYSRTPQFGGLQSQLDLALNPEWGNSAIYVSKVYVPSGTVYYEGYAAPQIIGGGSGQLIGGGNQIYVPQ